MDKLFIILSLLFFTSCKTCYEEVWCVDKYPMEWSDTIVYQEDHWHFKDQKNEWVCIELEPDTVYLEVRDTMYVEKLDWVYYTKNKKR